MTTALITGANRGIGLALTQFYCKLGFRVIALCRQSSTELDASDALVIEGVDVTNADQRSDLPQKIRALIGNDGLDILVNNAGIFLNETLPDLNTESIQHQFAVNALAPIALTDKLLPLLNNAAKIAFITSRMGSIADNGSGAYYGYRMSKAALNAGAVSLARDLKPKGIAVAIIHPGFVQTQMVNFAGDITADTAAERIARRINELTLATSGSFWHSNGETLPW